MPLLLCAEDPERLRRRAAECKDLRLDPARTSAWSNRAVVSPLPFLSVAVACPDTEDVYAVGGRLDAGVARVPIILATISSGYRDERFAVGELFVKARRPKREPRRLQLADRTLVLLGHKMPEVITPNARRILVFI